MAGSNRVKSRSGGWAFTIIEMMVVMVIITALVAILLPVFASLKTTARKNASQAQLVGLSAVCVEYKLQMRSSPGFVSENVLASNTVRTKFTSTENLVLSLLGGVVPQGTATRKLAGGVEGDLGIAADFEIDLDRISAGPRLYKKSALTEFRDYGAYYNPKPGELDTIAGDVNYSATPDSQMPELVDMPSEGMPILYLRKQDQRGVRPVTDDAAGDGDYFRNTIYDYVQATNLESKLKGVGYNQRANSLFSENYTSGGSATWAQAALSWYLTAPGLSRIGTNAGDVNRGSTANNLYGNPTTDDVLISQNFVLISPGPDGIYAGAVDTGTNSQSLYKYAYSWFDITDDQVIAGD